MEIDDKEGEIVQRYERYESFEIEIVQEGEMYESFEIEIVQGGEIRYKSSKK